jgi:II/X family phage/plasmid replication protein
MLIDWVTAYLPMQHIPREHWERLLLLTDRVMRYCPRTNETRWETAAWESVRSDSHQIAFRVGGDAIWIQGSPARVCGSGDAVFGEGAAVALDLPACVSRMAAFVAGQVGVDLSVIDVRLWHVTRIDVTANLLLDDLAAVRVALRILRDCEGGRYRVSQQAGDTVYWSHNSRLRSGKAYAKGPHIDYQTAKKDYSGRPYTESEKVDLNRLLRLELRLGAQWLRERAGKHWTLLTRNDLEEEWKDYFERMIGGSDMPTNELDLKQRIYTAAKTEGQGKAAYGCFLMIQAHGWEKAKEGYPRSTWYLHLKNLRAAGFSDADISAGKVVQLRQKVLQCQVVHYGAPHCQDQKQPKLR